MKEYRDSHNDDDLITDVTFRRLLYACIGVFIFSLIIRYFHNLSFWVDEIKLALNVITLSYQELLGPLKLGQGAPVVFLFVSKLFSSLVAENEFVLRFPVMLAAMAGCLIVTRCAMEEFPRVSVVMVTAFYAFSYYMVMYGVIYKHYTFDLFFTALILFYACRLLRCSDEEFLRKIMRFALLGLLAVCSSHASVFTLFGTGLGLFIFALFDRKYSRLPVLCVTGLCWLLMFGFLYLLTYSDLQSRDALLDYWKEGFWPLGGSVIEQINWFWVVMRTSCSICSIGAQMTSILVILGFCLLLKERRRFMLFVVLTGISALLASALGLYPLQERMLFFTQPYVCLLAGYGLGVIISSLARQSGFAAILLFFLLFSSAIYLQAKRYVDPAPIMEIRDILEIVAQKREDGDQIHLFGDCRQAMDFYAPSLGFEEQEYTRYPYKSSMQLVRFIQSLPEGRHWMIVGRSVKLGSNERERKMYYQYVISQEDLITDLNFLTNASAVLIERDGGSRDK